MPDKRVAVLLFAAAPLLGQVVGSTVSGTVTDPSGAAVAGATVVIRNEETGTERHLLTDNDGHYAAPSVSVGRYTVAVSADGFAPERLTGLDLVVGQALILPVHLRLTTSAEDVTVTDAAPTVNLSNEQVSGLVNERQVKELPLNGRSYDQLITLNPATVNYTSQRSGSIGTSNSSVGNMFSVSGRRPQDNLYLLNGVEYTGASLINVTPGGTSGQLLGVDAVREFNVVSDTYSASYGKRQGAQISIVTASGTNTLHGSVYEYLRNSVLDARNSFDLPQKPRFQRNNFGAALGGPLKKNTAFLFGNYEGYRQNLGLSDVTIVPNAASRAAAAPAVRRFLNLWPVANGPDLGGGIALAYSSPTQRIREDFGTARADANLSGKDLLFGVYTVDDSIAHTPTQNPLSIIDESLRAQVVSVQEQHVFTSRLLNTARVGVSRAAFDFVGSVPADVEASAGTFVAGRPVGAIVIAGSTGSNATGQLSAAGTNVGSNNALARTLYTVDDHIFYTVGKHQIEAGAWAQQVRSVGTLAQQQNGQANFASLQTFLQGTVRTFSYVPTPTALGFRTTMLATYLEDKWKPTDALEVSAGIRTESTNGYNSPDGKAPAYEFTNGVINATPTVGRRGLLVNRAKLLWEPRIGLAWRASGDGKTAVRAGFGVHRSLLDSLDYRFDSSPPFNTIVTYSNVNIATPTSGAAGLVSPQTVQNDLPTPLVYTWTARIERELSTGLSLTAGYIGSKGDKQILSSNLNEPASIRCNNNCPAGVANGRLYYPTTTRPQPALANTVSWVTGGYSNYNAGTLDLRQNLRGGLQFRAVYTFSKNLDNGTAWNTSVSSNTPAFVSYPKEPSLDYGLAATDVRHIAVFNSTYDLPLGHGHALLHDAGAALDRIAGGWSVANIVTAQSGLPLTPQLGYNPTGSGDTRNPVRPDVNVAFRGALYAGGSTAQRAARFFNPAAFSAPAYGTVGNVSRNTLTAPGFVTWDISLRKAVRIHERVVANFRAEAFNLLNHTNLGQPNPVVFTAGPTQGTSANRTAAVVANSSAGVITSAGTSRQLQMSLKLSF